MNNPIFSFTLLAALLGSTISAVSAGAEDKKPITDAWLTAKTKIALAADSRVKGREVSVETQKATVMLRGKVDDQASKMAAEEITRGIAGVTTVKNELQVVAPFRRDAVDDKDDAINDRVKKQLSSQPATRNLRIGVKTNAGVVSLSGEVKRLAHCQPGLVDCVAGIGREVGAERPQRQGDLRFSPPEVPPASWRPPGLLKKTTGGRQVSVKPAYLSSSRGPWSPRRGSGNRRRGPCRCRRRWQRCHRSRRARR